MKTILLKDLNINLSNRKFKESIDLIIHVRDIGYKQNASKRINSFVRLPHILSNKLRVGVIASSSVLETVTDKGMVKIDIEQIRPMAKNMKEAKKFLTSFDSFLAEISLMPEIIKSFGRILGPTGLMPMPCPKVESFQENYDKIVKSVKIQIKDKPLIFMKIGTADMKNNEIIENITAVLDLLSSKLEYGMKDIISIYVKTTMGKPVKLNHK